MRKFWIDIMEEGDGVRIEVGQGTEVTGFMSRTWDTNIYGSWPPTYVAFAAFGTEIEYKFCLNVTTTEATQGICFHNFTHNDPSPIT